MQIEAKNVWFRYSRHAPDVVRGVSLGVDFGESVGLVGESGSGKTTFARLLLGILEPTSGTVSRPSLGPDARAAVAMVHQDIAGSIDPLLRTHRVIEEGCIIRNKEQRDRQVQDLMEAVSLDARFLNRMPHELSGGQKQRVVIARALASGASTLILDEPTSALDAHVRLQIVSLLKELQGERDLSYLVISHDFQTIQRLCSRVAIMLAGEIIEEGPTQAILSAPRESYTQTLVMASKMQQRSGDEATQLGSVTEEAQAAP